MCLVLVYYLIIVGVSIRLVEGNYASALESGDTVKSVLSDHSKNDKTKILMTNAILSHNALRRDCSGRWIEWIEGHYLEAVVEV